MIGRLKNLQNSLGLWPLSQVCFSGDALWLGAEAHLKSHAFFMESVWFMYLWRHGKWFSCLVGECLT